MAIVAVGSEIARSDLSGLFQFAAIVNINLAVVNALPLPALDGGFLALLLAEAVRGELCFCRLHRTSQSRAAAPVWFRVWAYLHCIWTGLYIVYICLGFEGKKGGGGIC